MHSVQIELKSIWMRENKMCTGNKTIYGTTLHKNFFLTKKTMKFTSDGGKPLGNLKIMYVDLFKGLPDFNFFIVHNFNSILMLLFFNHFLFG